MEARPLRPLAVGEILDAGIKIYRKNARTLMALTAAVVLPFEILSALVTLSTVHASSEVSSGFGRLGVTGTTDRAASLGGNVLVSLIGILVGLFTTAVCVKAVSDAYLDRPVEAAASARFALRRVGSLLWLEIMLTVLLALAFIALVIPGIWLYAAWAVATPALLIEGVRGSRALGRSYELVHGRWWPTAGVLLVANLIVAVVGGAISATLVGIVLSGATRSVVSTVFLSSLAAAVSSILTRPFQAAVTTVLYYDLRVRKDGYDVELLAEQLGIAPPALGASAAGPGAHPPTYPPPPGTPALPGAPAAIPAGMGPESVGMPGGPPYWPPPPGWRPPQPSPSPGGSLPPPPSSPPAAAPGETTE